MKLEKNDLKALLEIAKEAALEAGLMIANASLENVRVEKKETSATEAGQAVTEVDRQSQKIILNRLEPTLQKFDLGMLAEESEDDLSRLEKDAFWCVDPLDGTLQFVEHRTGYGVSIALVSREGAPLVGVVYDPVDRVLYYAAQGQGAFRNEEPWILHEDQALETKVVSEGGAVMNACWVLEKAPAVFYKKPKSTQGGGCLWDYAAVSCLYAELGAWVSDMSGNPLHLNRKDSLYFNDCGVLFATNQAIAQKVLEAHVNT